MRTGLTCGLALALLAAPALAGTWVEVGDAPSGPVPAQITDGTGPLDLIIGATHYFEEWEDAYCIRITDVDAFYATTDPTYDPRLPEQWDSRLWLFTPEGDPVLGNDDAPNSAGYMSLLTDPSTFPGALYNSPSALTPGEYVLIISAYADDPLDAAGAELFSLGSDYDALHGPNPNAGAFDHWDEAAYSYGDYQIGLGGATFCIPEPATMALVMLGGLALIRRR